MKLIKFLFFTFLFIFGTLSAQIKDPVKLSYEVLRWAIIFTRP